MKEPNTGNISARPSVVRADEAMWEAADLGRCHGGIMRIRRAIIITAILALSTAGGILAGSAMPAIAAQATSAHVSVTASAPLTVYYG